MDIRTTKQKYNYWKAINFLKEHGEYKRYLNEKWIAFDGAGFKHFPKEIYYLKGLEGLDLYNNQIKHIPKEISYLKKIRALNIDYNQISRIPKEISYLKNLERLNLLGNQITHIPKEICYLKKLEILNLSNNQITHIPKEISHLKSNLKIIWIEDNPLEQQTKEDIKELLPNTKIF